MKSFSINPVVFAIALLGSFALGAIVTKALDNRALRNGYHQGNLAGRLATQRHAANVVSVLMTEGVIVRQPSGANTRYVLKPVATPGP